MKRAGRLDEFPGPGRGWHRPCTFEYSNAPEHGECRVHGCGKTPHARGFCGNHYNTLRRRGLIKTDKIRAAQIRNAEGCHVTSCIKKARHRGYCNSHYHRLRRYGDPTHLPETTRHRYQKKTLANGYVTVWCPGDPHAKLSNGTRAFEHRLVMADMIGRPLRQNEAPHHINGNRADNRPENLELWVRAQPTGQRVEDMVAWAEEILECYRPVVAALTRAKRTM
ncbi:MAG: HNH endonuclease [Proteobacteria bacterium]|nr:HNH endonuclease [Pseudomonadota bacterium]